MVDVGSAADESTRIRFATPDVAQAIGLADLAVSGSRLINLAFGGEYRSGAQISPYRGSLAVGGLEDLWNSVGICGWPCKPENL